MAPRCSGSTLRSFTVSSSIETVMVMFSCGWSWVLETGMARCSPMFTLMVEAWYDLSRKTRRMVIMSIMATMFSSLDLPGLLARLAPGPPEVPLLLLLLELVGRWRGVSRWLGIRLTR